MGGRLIIPAFQTVLRAAPAAPAPPMESRAIWLDARLARWPQMEPAGRFRLYHSAHGHIVAAPGGVVRGSGTALSLSVFGGDAVRARAISTAWSSIVMRSPGPRSTRLT